MKLRKARIKRYKSLVDVELEFGDFSVLFGENNSGKTNILEALYVFFENFDLVSGESPFIDKPSSWYNKDVDLPIEITVTLELTEEESSDIFGERLTKTVGERLGERHDTLTICRQVPNINAPWITKLVKWGDLTIVKDDKVLSPEEIAKLRRGLTREAKVYQFHRGLPKAYPIVDRIVVLRDKAYHADSFIEDLVKEGKVPVEDVYDVHYRYWIDRKGLSFVKRTPTKQEIMEYLPPDLAVPEVIKDLGKKIRDKLRGSLELIPVARDIRIGPGERESFLDKATVINEYVKLSMSDRPEDERRWYRIRESVEGLIKRRLDVLPELSLWENGLRLPIRYVGGGDQEIIGLVWQIYQRDGQIALGIEEPEIHLHPNRSRELFDFLKAESRNRQIIIVTHSPIFMDREDPENNWWVFREGKETKVERMKGVRDMRKASGRLVAESPKGGWVGKMGDLMASFFSGLKRLLSKRLT